MAAYAIQTNTYWIQSTEIEIRRQAKESGVHVFNYSIHVSPSVLLVHES